MSIVNKKKGRKSQLWNNVYILFVFGARKMKSITTIIVQNVKKKLRSKIDVPKLRILAQKSTMCRVLNVQISSQSV